MRHLPFLRSLSSRLLVITFGVILISEALVFIPGLARERRGWIERHLREATLVAAALSAGDDPMPEAGIDAPTRARLLALADCEMIRLRENNSVVLSLGPLRPIAPDLRIDLDREEAGTGLVRAIAALFRREPRQVYLMGHSALHPATSVELLVDERSLLTVLHAYTGRVLGVSLAVATITGALVTLAVALLLVRPVRRITRSIAAFRRDPERSVPLDERRMRRAGSEIAVAGQELAALQRELREALWRNARLAALGTAVAKVTHDVRGILSAAMLSADRLASHADPKVQRAAETILRSVERATELVRDTLAYTRDGPPPLNRQPVALQPLIEEAAEGVVGLRLDLDVASGIIVDGDRTALLRMFGNLVRNAREAGARSVRIAAGAENGVVTIDVADDGPGLPEQLQAHLFRPFATGRQAGGTGLGLAITRDLSRAHGGDIALVSTGAQGTMFRLSLPAAKLPAADLRQAS